MNTALTTSLNTALIAASIALLAGSAGALAGQGHPLRSCPPPVAKPTQTIDLAPGQIQQAPPKVEVVFVLDTTGSMGGLIESAKNKIWSIASTIAQAQPSPEIRMGLVAYRDRGDDYVTKRTPMTDDLDTLYSELMSYQARGGGDGPESVNQALFEAVERFDWSEGDDVLRIVYLVGDAPPKMNFEDDVKHPATCRFARERGILINTIQCGSMTGTRDVWQTIAQNANGAFAAIPQDGGTKAIATPFDEEIKQLDQELSSLMIDYGDQDMKRYQFAKRMRAGVVAEAASEEAAADRAVYNQSHAGRTNLYGRQELVSDVISGKVSLDEVPNDHLPADLQSKPMEELTVLIASNNDRRVTITARLGELGLARREFAEKATPGGRASAFDAQVVEILTEQAARIGLTIHQED